MSLESQSGRADTHSRLGYSGYKSEGFWRWTLSVVNKIFTNHGADSFFLWIVLLCQFYLCFFCCELQSYFCLRFLAFRDAMGNLGELCLSVCLSVCLSTCLPLCLPFCRSVWLSGCLAVWLSGCLSVCLSVTWQCGWGLEHPIVAPLFSKIWKQTKQESNLPPVCVCVSACVCSYLNPGVGGA